MDCHDIENDRSNPIPGLTLLLGGVALLLFDLWALGKFVSWCWS